MSEHRKQRGANGAHRHVERPAHPAPGPAAAARPRLDVRRLLAGRRILVTGATGFVGKVALSMLLERYPEVGRVFVLVRPGTGGTPEARFFDKVAPSRPFDPLRARYGAGFDAFLRERCVPLAGDVSDPLLGLSEADLARVEGLDLVLSSAGLVDFNPSLELAIGVNVQGARNAVDLCRRTGAGLLHVSTCYVAGNRDGVVHEDEEIRGYFPRREGVVGRPRTPALDGTDFDLDAELADAARHIAEVRERAEDHVLASGFRDRALERLRAEGRSGQDERSLRLAIGRERRLWISGQLVEIGMARARHWGWTNTYTYTKSLGEQAIAASDVPWALVRPAIVESALRYPFPGWNEGFTTSAPLAFLGLKGHRSFPAAEKAILDVVPVDLVAAGMIAAAAELLERRETAGAPRGRVFHLASGDVNPLWVPRAVELSGLYRRRYYREREEGNHTWNKLLSRIEPYPVSRARYEAFSAPALAALARGANKLLRERSPRWGAPRATALAHEISEALDEWTRRLEKVEALWDAYLPFVWENRYVFRCAAIRELRDRLSAEDRARIPWDPEALDWRRYWLDVHMKGMEEWVFPGLEEEDGKRVHAPKAHRDLLELLDSACERWKDRVALRMEGAAKERLTYAELRALSSRVAGFLTAAGVVKGDRVILSGENRPEWAVSFFGILRAGAAAVPVDPKLSGPEIANLWRTSGARLALVSDQAADALPGLAALAAASDPGARVVTFGEALRQGGPSAAPARVAPDDLASLIFTSGTTGTPKGVMLSHRNFASLVAKLSGVFDLGPGDGMLSVLPLHHTFEFTCGLLVPLSRGAEVEYLDELTADRIGEALGSGRVTAMIGVPALWSLLHRRITQEVAAKPGLVQQAFEALRKGNAALRDSALGWNLGKALFWPVHRRFGGRLRILVSGGSAIDPEVQKAFRELGFDLYEGYGLTEAAPVLAVSKTDADTPAGSVGPALAGVELRIAAPDASGVGEVLARGPNVMLGYWRGGDAPGVDPELSGEVLEGGWLRTGDLGRLDADGNLTLVGRKKDVIIDSNGKNVYPDEIEERYRAPELVEELCVVGLPDGSAEKVAMIVVPAYRERDRAEVRAAIEAHLRTVTASLPFHQRVKVWHLFDGDLPKTSTRKVKRPLVREELQRLEAAAARGRRAREGGGAVQGDGWLLDLVADVSRRPRAEITGDTRLQADLGLDSLMLTELAAALEEAGVAPSATEGLSSIQTVGELALAIQGNVRRAADRVAPPPAAAPESGHEDIAVPEPMARLGRRLLAAGQRALYRDLYRTRVVGEAFVPHDRNVLVVANHASHLDMGLVKIALGDEGSRLAALAARDYFFDTRLKRAYFENFTNLIPMERAGALKSSLRAASEALRRGYHLLIFPEGTRTRDGEMHPFYPTAGYLSLQCGVDVLPVFLGGTHAALPPGRTLPRQADLEVRFGEVIAVEALRARTAGLSRSESYRAATRVMEEAVRSLRRAAEAERGGAGEPAPRGAPIAPAPTRARPAVAPGTAGPPIAPKIAPPVMAAGATVAPEPGRARRHAAAAGPAPHPVAADEPADATVRAHDRDGKAPAAPKLSARPPEDP
jgi:long-chain acyl-CoA synthetase